MKSQENTATYLAQRFAWRVIGGSPSLGQQLPADGVETRSLLIGCLAENFRKASKEPLKGCARSEPDPGVGVRVDSPSPKTKASVQSTLTSKEKL